MQISKGLATPGLRDRQPGKVRITDHSEVNATFLKATDVLPSIVPNSIRAQPTQHNAHLSPMAGAIARFFTPAASIGEPPRATCKFRESQVVNRASNLL